MTSPALAATSSVVVRKHLTLQELRERYRAPASRKGGVDVALGSMASWLGEWPSGGVSEVCGGVGGGRLALILPAMRALARLGEQTVIIDARQTFHPPSVPELVDHVLLIRPPSEQVGWCAEQVARAGVVRLLVVLDAGPLGRGGLRLAKAAEGHSGAVILVSEASDPDLPAALRLGVSGWQEHTLRVSCTRSRDGRAVGEHRVRFDAHVIPGVWT